MKIHTDKASSRHLILKALHWDSERDNAHPDLDSSPTSGRRGSCRWWSTSWGLPPGHVTGSHDASCHCSKREIRRLPRRNFPWCCTRLQCKCSERKKKKKKTYRGNENSPTEVNINLVPLAKASFIENMLIFTTCFNFLKISNGNKI